MANWNYMTSGVAFVVEINEGANIPNIPGYLSSDMKITGPLPKNLSTHCGKLWPGAFRNKRYSTLPKVKAVLSQLAYGYYGQYNTGSINGNNCGNMGWTQEIISTSGKATEWYVGCIVYQIRRGSHRGGWPDDYLAKATITITLIDGTTQIVYLRGPRRGPNDGGYSFPNESQPYKTRGAPYPVTIWKSGKTSKPIKKITVVSTVPNWGYEYHDIGDCNWIRSEYIQNKENTFYGCFGTYNLENKIPFELKSGTPVDKCESPVLIINGISQSV